jgi:hypothetical protein
MRWLLSLGSVLIVAVVIGWFASPALGWSAGLFGAVAVLFAWRAGVAGDTSRHWARELYGSGDRDGPDYASVMGRQLARPSARGRRGRGAGRSAWAR